MEALHNLLELKAHLGGGEGSGGGSLYLSKAVGAPFPFLPHPTASPQIEATNALEGVTTALQRRFGDAEGGRGDGGGPGGGQSHSWVYASTVGGVERRTATTTVLQGRRRQTNRKRHFYSQRGRRRRRRKRRRKIPWQQQQQQSWRGGFMKPWVGSKLGEEEEEGSLAIGRAAGDVANLEEDLVGEASTMSASGGLRGISELWHRRWAHLGYLDYLPAAAETAATEFGVKAFRGPRPQYDARTTTTTTKRPNIFHGDDWVSRLVNGDGDEEETRVTTLHQHLSEGSYAISEEEEEDDDDEEDLQLKYVPVFPDRPTPYYKSVVVSADGEVVSIEKQS